MVAMMAVTKIRKSRVATCAQPRLTSRKRRPGGATLDEKPLSGRLGQLLRGLVRGRLYLSRGVRESRRRTAALLPLVTLAAIAVRDEILRQSIGQQATHRRAGAPCSPGQFASLASISSQGSRYRRARAVGPLRP